MATYIEAVQKTCPLLFEINRIARLLFLLFIVFFLVTCSSPESDDSESPPGNSEMVVGITNSLSDDLKEAGFTNLQIQAIKSGILKEISSENLSQSSSIGLVSAAALKGAQLSLAAPDVALTSSNEKIDAITLFLKCITKYLDNKVSNEPSSSFLSPVKSVFASPNASNKDSYLEIYKKLAEITIQYLDDAGIDSTEIIAASKKVTETLAGNMTIAGVIDDELAEISRSIVKGAISALDESGIEDEQKDEAIQAVLEGALVGLHVNGLASGEIAEIADDVTEAAVLALSDAGIADSEIDTFIYVINTSVNSGLAEAGLTTEEIAAVQDSIAEATQEGKSALIENERPIAIAQYSSVDEDHSLGITLTGSDHENADLTYILVRQTSNGVISGTPPDITYTPNNNFNGSDYFIFKVNDGELNSSNATCDIDVNAVNDAPVAIAQSLSFNEDNSQLITLSGTDIEGSSLEFSVTLNPTNGVLSGTIPNLTYTPNEHYHGSDSFSFKVNDGFIDSTADAIINLSIASVNDDPTTDNIEFVMDENTSHGFELKAGDVEGAELMHSIVQNPSHGILSGEFPNLVYTPTAEYFGEDSFTYRVNDGIADSNISTVSISVTEVSDCTSTQSGELLNSATFGRGGCGNATNNVTILSGHSVSWDGTGGPILGDFIINEGGILTITGTEAVITGNIALNGGELNLEENLTVSNSVEIQSSSTIEIASEKTLTYEGNEIDIGDNTLNFAGEGTFDNSNNINLNSASSILKTSGSNFVISKVAVNNSDLIDGKIECSSYTTITALTLDANVQLDIASGETLRVTDQLWVKQNKTLKLLNEGTLDVDHSLLLNGSIIADIGTLDLREADLSMETNVDLSGAVLLTDTATNLTLLADVSLSTDQKITANQLNLNQRKLSLNTSTTDLALNSVEIEDASEGISTNNADLVVKNVINMTTGNISSTGGTISFPADTQISGGSLDLTDSELVLNGNLNLTGTTVIEPPDTLRLETTDAILTGANALNTDSLNLQNHALTLSSANLTVVNEVFFDHDNEKIITGSNNLTLTSGFSMSSGEISSTGGSITISGSQSGGVLSLSGSTLTLNGNLTVFAAGLTAPEHLSISTNATLSGTGGLSVTSLNLNNKALTLSDNLSTSELVVFDSSGDQINTGSNDLTLGAGCSMSSGSITSTGGNITISGDTSGGNLNLPNTTLILNGDIILSSSSSIFPTNLALISNATLTYEGLDINVDSLTLNNHALTVSKSLQINNPLELDQSEEKIITGTNNLTIAGDLTMSNGTISSIGGGTVSFPTETSISGGTINLEGSTLQLLGDLNLTGASFTAPEKLQTTATGTTLTGAGDITIDTLEFEGGDLTLSSTNLTVIAPISFENSSSKIITDSSNLSLVAPFSMSSGAITSTGGTITLHGNASGGTLDFTDSTLVLKGNFNVIGSSFFPPENLSLTSDAYVQGVGDLSIANLELNDKKLIMTSGLTVENEVLFDHQNEKIDTWHPLILSSGLSMSNGEIRARGDTLKLSGTVTGGTIETGSHSVDLNGDLEISSATLPGYAEWALNNYRLTMGNNVETNNQKIKLNGGVLEINGDISFRSTTITASSTINVLAGKSLYLGENRTDLGDVILNLSGGGEIYTEGCLNLNHHNSVLLLSGQNGMIECVKVAVIPDVGKIDVQADFTIMNLIMENDTNISITAGNLLNVGNQLSAMGALNISGTGDLLLHDIVLNGDLDFNGSVILAPDASLYVISPFAVFKPGSDLDFQDGLYIAEGAMLIIADDRGTFTVSFSGGVSINDSNANRIVLAGDESLIINYPVPDADILAQITNNGTGTVTPSMSSSPPDITEFAALPGDGLIYLSWTIQSGDIENVMIRRSMDNYPDSTMDGVQVYFGNTESTTDSSEIYNGAVYYYTAFTENALGDFSAGVHARSVATYIPSGLVGYYQFDGSSKDSSPTGNHSMIFGDVALTTDIKGEPGKALNFDGDRDYLEIDNPVQDDFTISFWLKTNQYYIGSGDQWYGGISIVDGKIGDGQNDFGISKADGQILFGTGGPDTTITAGLGSEDDYWRHVTVSRDRTSGRLKQYYNGFLVATGTGGTESLSDPKLIRIGGAPFGEKFYEGSLDELRFYDRVISETEVFQLNCKDSANLCTLIPDSGQSTSYADTTGDDGDYSANSPSYTDNGDGTITDIITDLVWQKATPSAANWSVAYYNCHDNNHGLPGSGWRLPTYNELLDLVDFSTGSPAIHSVFSPTTESSYYWSNTTYSGNPTGEAWIVNFGDGYSFSDSIGSENNYRCVRKEPISTGD